MVVCKRRGRLHPMLVSVAEVDALNKRGWTWGLSTPWTKTGQIGVVDSAAIAGLHLHSSRALCGAQLGGPWRYAQRSKPGTTFRGLPLRENKPRSHRAQSHSNGRVRQGVRPGLFQDGTSRRIIHLPRAPDRCVALSEDPDSSSVRDLVLVS